MNRLNLDLFISAVHDLETAKYRVLDALKDVRNAFQDNKVYPHLSDLIALNRVLQHLMERTDSLREGLPKEIEEIDLQEGKIHFSWPELDQGEMAEVRDLIRWAQPKIKDAMEEGRIIFEFVDENLSLEEVGLVPSYVDEGYVLLPELEEKSLHVLQYQMTIFTSADEKYRSLRTAPVKELAWKMAKPPQEIKLDLIAERQELPNPATFFFDTAMEFPFQASVMPVAKRKLMRHLAQMS